MFENYAIFVKIALKNEVTRGLSLLSSQFNQLHKDADRLQQKLNSIKTLTLTGTALAATGFFGLNLISKALKPAEEYAHQLNIMNMAGLTQKEIAEATGDAWKNTSKVITTTSTGNLRALLDMRNILGDMEEARVALPLVTKMQAVLMSSKEGRELATSQDFANDVAKALDIVGAVKNKADFEREALLMGQVVTATQGRVTPKMFQSVFAFARQAKLEMNDEFKYRFLPTLMLEYSSGHGGGGSKGVGPMIAAMYRFTNQGYINKKALPELIDLGLVKPGTALKTTTSGTTVDALAGADIAASNPFEWVQRVLMPALRKKYGDKLTKHEIASHINQITRGNQLAASAFTEFALQPQKYLKDAALIMRAMTVDQAYQKALMNDPYRAREALSAQWENLQISLTTPLVTILMPALSNLAVMFNYLATKLQEHPKLAKTLSYALTGLSAALAFSGTVLLAVAAFKGLALSMTYLAVPVTYLALPLVGITVAIGILGFGIYKLWKLIQRTDLKVFTDQIAKLFEILKEQIHLLIYGEKSPIKAPTGVELLGGGGVLSNLANNQSKLKINYPPHSGTTIQVHSKIILDKNEIGKAVTKHQVKEATRSPNYSSRFDSSMTPVAAGVQNMGSF